MRLVRRFALKISEFVVTHASPGSKEWAEGLAREIDCIESDWSALGWASGSVRVLFDYRPSAIRSLADLTVAAEKFVELKRHAVNNVWLATNMRWLNMLFPALMFMHRFFRAVDGRNRASNGMIVIGLLTLAIDGFIRSKEPVVPDRDDFPAIIQFYKKELERSCSLSSFDFWGFVAGSVLVGTGFALAITATWELLLGIVWLGLVGLFLQTQRNNRRRLRQIEALLNEKQ